MGYSEDDSMVRVDFFKPSGKWYCTETVRWLTYHSLSSQLEGKLTHDAFREALENHFNDNPGRLRGMTAICLEPYHEHAHPISIIIGRVQNESVL